MAKCYGFKDYEIIICCDPGCDEIINLAKSFTSNQSEIIVNENKLGCSLNIYQCLEIGFSKNDYHIHFEDDTIPGKDCLKYFEWAREKYKYCKEIFTVTGYNKTEKCFLDIDKAIKRKWFTPWGWATWIDRFEDIKNLYNSKEGQSWDVTINNITRQDRFEVFPVVSRIQNIGAKMGVHVPNAEWHKKNQFNEWWIESIKKYNISKFYEINVN